MKLVVILPLLSITLSLPVQAKEYIGLRFCEPIKISTIKKIVIDAGGDVAPLTDEDNRYPDDGGEISFGNYPIASGRYLITLYFFDKKIYNAVVNDAQDLESALDDKYGKPYKITRYAISSGNATSHLYAARNDPDMKIDFNTYISPNVVSTDIWYTCKSLEKRKLDAEQRAAKKARSVQNTGKSL